MSIDKVKDNIEKKDLKVRKFNSIFKSKIYYNNNLKKFKTNKKFIVDKAPLNFKWIGLILKLFPGCKIIHSTRDPMDICFSNFKNSFSSKTVGFRYNLDKLGNY